MEQINEQWLPIEGYERLYEVSNLGKVKSIGYRKERILKPAKTKNGYLRVTLFKEGKHKMFMVHRLVAHAFITNPDNLPQINHKDEDKTNNLVDNLEWCDGKYNVNYGTRAERYVQTRINNGTADPELCGIVDKKEYDLMYRHKNRVRLRERHRKYLREWRKKNKQEEKNNKPSEESLW